MVRTCITTIFPTLILLSSYPQAQIQLQVEAFSSKLPGKVRANSKSTTQLFGAWHEFAETTLPNIDDSFAEQQWYLPSIVERALIDQDTSVCPFQLLQALDMSGKTRALALEAIQNYHNQQNLLQTFPQILSRDECYTLQNYLWKYVHKQCGIDDVDQCADWQVNLEEDELIKLIGKQSLQRIYQIPSLLKGSPFAFERVGIFLRVYERSPQGRPWMPFHSDGNAYTVNIALNNDDEFQGGRLLALADNALQLISRQQGDATCHAGSLYHAVSAMNSGRRYSMILFFHQAEEKP